MSDVDYHVRTIFEGVDQITPALQSAGQSTTKYMANYVDVHDKAITKTKDFQQRLAETKRTMDELARSATDAGNKEAEAGRRAAEGFNYAGESAKALKRQISEAFSIIAIEEFARHSYNAFVETETNMRRLQVATGASRQEIEHLQHQFESLASETGRSLGELTTGFRDFMARSGLEEGEAAKAFKEIAEAAEIAGVDIRDMSRLTGTAMADLKLRMEDMPHVTAEFAKSLAALGPGAARPLEHMVDQLTLMGAKGAPAIESLEALSGAASKMVGSTQKGLEAVDAIVTDFANPNGKMRQLNMQLAQAVAQGAAGPTQIMEVYIDRARRAMAAAHGDITVYQREMDAYGITNQATQLLMIKILDQGIDKWHQLTEEQKKSLRAVSDVDKAHEEFTAGGLKALHELGGAWEKLESNVGALLERLGASKALKDLADDVERVARAIDHINNLEPKEALKSLLGIGEKGDKPGEGEKTPLGYFNQFMAHPARAPLHWMGVPGFQSGGVVDKPTVAMIGEAGPEAVVPLFGQGGMGGGGGTQTEREAAEMWGRLHGEAMQMHKHVDLKGQLSDEELSRLLGPGGGMGGGAGGGGGGGGRDTGWGPGSGHDTGHDSSSTGPPGVAPPLARGITGSPLAGLHGNLPFGLNVDPQRFSAITGLPPSFMNVSPESAARAAEISRGGGVGMEGQFVGGKTGADWPTVAAATGSIGGGIDRSKLAKEMSDPRMRAYLGGVVAAEVGGQGTAAAQIEAESIMNRAMARGQSVYGAINSGYHPASVRNARPLSGAALAAFEQNVLNPALAGSDVGGKTLGFTPTGNASQLWFAERRRQQGIYAQAKWLSGEPGKGEMFVLEKQDVAGTQRFARLPEQTQVAGGPVSVSSITSGVPAGTWEGGGGSSLATAGVGQQAGDIMGDPRHSGGAFNVPAGFPVTKTPGTVNLARGGTLKLGGAQEVTLSNGVKFQVDASVAPQYKGFFEDLIKAGAPVHNLAGYGHRSGNPSQHPIGYGVDWAQGIGGHPGPMTTVSSDVWNWMQSNPQQLAAIENKWGMSGWGDVSDPGHVSVQNVWGSEHLAALEGGQGTPTQVAGPGGMTTPPPRGLTPWPSGRESGMSSDRAAMEDQLDLQGTSELQRALRQPDPLSAARNPAQARSATRSAEVERGEAFGLQERLARAGTPSPGTPIPRARPRLQPGSEAARGEAFGLQERLAQADRDHAAMQAHADKNPIKIPVTEEHSLSAGARRQAFSRSVKWSASRANARRSHHENLVDNN